MPIAAVVMDQWWDGKKLWVDLQLTLSGNYTSGGDTLNLQNLGVLSSGIPSIMDVLSSLPTAAATKNNYQWTKGTTQANGIVRCFTGTTEVSTGAYPANMTGDTVYARFKVKGFR
jgi:hypothetical protein